MSAFLDSSEYNRLIMKKILAIFILSFLAVSASAQHWVHIYSYNDYLGLQTDSVLIPPQDTTFSNPTVGMFAIFNGHVYQRLSTAWSQVDGGGNAVQSLTGSQSIQYGAYSAMPTPGTPGRYYAATDSLSIYFDNGISWLTISKSVVSVPSVFGRTGNVTADSGDYSAAQVGLANVLNSLQIVNTQGTPSASSDILANRPVAGTAGRLFVSTDSKEIYRDNGTSWDKIGSGASGVAGSNPTAKVGAAPVNGTAGTFMRSDAAPALDTTYSATLTAVKDSIAAVRTALGDSSARSFHLTIRGQGQPGDTTLITATDSTIHVAAIRDSLGFHHAINPDGSWTLYAAGGGSSVVGKSPVVVSVGTADSVYLDTTMLINAQYPYGYEYNKQYFYDTLDFRNSTNTTMSADTSMHLDIGNNGSTDSTGNVIKMVNATLLEKFVMTAQVIVTTTGKGFGIGLYGQNAAEPISLLGFVPTAGVAVGKASLTTESNSTWASQNVSSTAISISAGDTLTCVLTRADSVITFTVTQSAFKGGASSTATFNYTLNAAPLPPNTAFWGLWPMGGAYTVTSLSIYTPVPRNATLMVEGDSKTQGLEATYWADRFVNRLNAANPNYQTVVDGGGGGDFTDQVIARLHEIKWLHPARVLLYIGSNDERNGRTLLQWETNYDYIADQLTKAGIPVYHLLQTNETTLSFTAYNNHILQTFPANRIVNAGTVSLFADGIHPDSAGHRQIADSIISQIGSQIFPIAPIIPAVRLTDILTSADTGAAKTWPVNRIIKATSLGYPRQIPFGTNQQNFSLTGAQVSGGGLSQSANLTFDSATNILHIGNPAVGPNLTDLAGNGAFLTQGFNPNSSLQYIPTTTSASAIYMTGGVIYWYQNTGLTVGTAFTLRNTFEAIPGTNGSSFVFNPTNSTAGVTTLTTKGDAYIDGTLTVEPITSGANPTIALNTNAPTHTWYLNVNISDSSFYIKDFNSGFSPVDIAPRSPTGSLDIFSSGNVGFGTSSDKSTATIQGVSTTQAQLGLYNGSSSSLFTVGSGGSLGLTGLTGLTINSTALPTGTTTDSVLVETTSSNIATVKKVAQSSIGGGSQTLQTVLTAGPNFATNNTIGLAGHVFGLSGLVGPPSTYSAVVHSNASDSGLYQIPMSSGTYTPTITNVSNVSASTAGTGHYIRVGNQVTVDVPVVPNITLTATATEYYISLPISSTISFSGDLTGTGTGVDPMTAGLGITGNTTNHVADVTFTPTGTGSNNMYLHFTYTVD
jgi:lysophospholipase L1-like esterase